MNRKVSLFKELKRRNVFKVAIAYVISSWLLAQVADLVLDNFGAPQWSMRVLLIVLAIGFPIALVISWVFEVTPEGVVHENQIDRTISITDQSGKRLDRTIIAILAIVIIFMGLERFFFSGHGGWIMGPGSISQNVGEMQNPIVIEKLNPAPLSPSSVAVLPFAVMSTGPDDEYFADGLTEEIINALSQLPELMVTARTSAFHFKGQNIPIGEIARQLGVANVVEGSVRRAGEQLRVSAQLVRTEDGFHLWSETYDRHTEDTFAVQQDIAEKVATTMNVLLDENRLAHMVQASMRNIEAFIAFQKGREFLTQAHREGVDISLLRQANAQFEEVMALVPDYSDTYLQHADLHTHVLLSHASGQLDGNITDSDIEAAPDALRFDYDQAVRYARNDSQRLIAEADRALVTGDWRGLAALSERALLTAGCEVPFWAHLTSAPYGKAQALHTFARLVACDPFMVRAQVYLAVSNLWLKQPQLAQQAAENALQSDDHHALIWAKVLALAMQGDFPAAEQTVNNRQMPDEERPFALSTLAAMRGEFEQASDYQDDYLSLHGPDDQSTLVMEAERGNHSEANRLAAQIDHRPFGYMVLMHAIYLCTCGAPFDLEATPVFAGMLAESGLPWPPLKPINFPLKDW